MGNKKEITMLLKIFADFFNNQDLDIRKKGNNPRFLDQKCTPDVISFIADCICQVNKNTFDRNDIWQSDYFIKNASFIFGKPSPKNRTASHEYDKLILQPLDLFSYSGILSKQKTGLKNIFSIQEKKILELIARNEKDAFLFLFCYLDKFVKDSGLSNYLNIFLQKQDKESFTDIKNRFIRFLLAYSKIGSRQSANGGEVEIRRIFPKFLNIFAVYKQAKGSIKGHLSKGIFLMADLMYNRMNFRDIYKLKNITRSEQQQIRHSTPAKYRDFQTQKAMKWMKQHHPYSEVNDRLYGKTDCIHHIFPKSEFPEISYYIENLIALTAGQHTTFAHPHGNTNTIDKMYQKVCLKSKVFTIEKELKKTETQYSLPDFIFVLTKGFKQKVNIPVDANFDTINNTIDSWFNK